MCAGGFSNVDIPVLSDLSPPAETGAAMATVYLVTAASGESHHVERV